MFLEVCYDFDSLLILVQSKKKHLLSKSKKEMDSLAIYRMLTLWLSNQYHHLLGTCLFKYYSHLWKTLWKAQTIGWCVYWDTKQISETPGMVAPVIAVYTGKTKRQFHYSVQ